MPRFTGETITDDECMTFASYLSAQVIDLAVRPVRNDDEIGNAARLGARTLCAAVANYCTSQLRGEPQPRGDIIRGEGGAELTPELTVFIASGGDLQGGADAYMRVLAKEVLWLRARMNR